MLKLTERVGIIIFLLYKQKTRWNLDIQNFYSEILNFRLFYAKNRNLAQFSGPACLDNRDFAFSVFERTKHQPRRNLRS